ncbi:helix-turn-helix domain-containing protein [Streptomyces sp. A1499]|uniref:helix-turn-helix domain-containing protein n=1 Tax=Streptomyces sp. A1499 TaxID=2563104 RepID=UPI001F0F3CC1|nr:helix-turn-helix domain-containing protein [Streptomyces sp. A1499]
MEALRTTLSHYLSAERSLVEVAGRLHVARATVTHRVKRAREALGHDLDDRRFTLHAALALSPRNWAMPSSCHVHPRSERRAKRRPDRTLGPADQRLPGPLYPADPRLTKILGRQANG